MSAMLPEWPAWLSITTAAKYTNTSRDTVSSWLRHPVRPLPYVQMVPGLKKKGARRNQTTRKGSAIRIQKSVLDQYLAQFTRTQ